MENMRFKKGDRVRIKSLDWYNANKNIFGKVWTSDGHIPFEICMSVWCGKVMTISFVGGDYYTMVEDLIEYWTDEMIEGLAEEETKTNIIEEAKTYWDSIKDAWICPEGYIFKDENGNVINATKIVLEKKKKEYPKTYEECCKVLGVSVLFDFTNLTYKEADLYEAFIYLIRCRDAYWKIAGEEMGLGKPWKPDWKNENQRKYCICNDSGDIKKVSLFFTNSILSFPTEEMRDAFCENFKELIESVKEFL